MRAAGRLALAVAAGAAAAAFAFGSSTIRLLDRLEVGYRHRLQDHLQGRHGLAVYAPLDAGIPVNVASGRLLDAGDARVVPGRIGEARRFDAGMERSIGTDVRWSRFAARGGTISLWLDLSDADRDQFIVWDRATGVESGLRLKPDRTLEAVFTDGTGVHAIAAPLPPPGRFAPVAFVFSNERAALWIDGREVAAATVSGGLRLPSHPISFGPAPGNPLVGALDEISVWLRPLSAPETAALASSARTVAGRLEPWRARRAAAVRALSAGFRTAERVLDRLVPSFGSPAMLRTDVPEFDLALSKKDERHFLLAHEASLRAGRRTRKAARSRAVFVDWAGADVPAFLSLDDAYGPASPERPDPVARPSYLLRGEPGDFGSGVGLARLVPPERFGSIHPDAPRPLPLEPGCFVRLVVDGDFRGIYVLEPFDAPGGGWRVSGDRRDLRSDHLLRDSLPAAAGPAGGGLLPETEARRRWNETLSLLRSDVRFPWSGAEARWRERLHAERRVGLGFGTPRLAAIDLMGNNPSPFYVTNDIDLAAAGPGVSWRSSDPATLDADGTVRRVRCDGDLPRTVDLTGSFPDGTERAFRFRVMPEKPRLPALFLYVADPVWKHRRTDFASARIPAGGGSPEILTGTASTGGGIRHRGNTSYVRGSRRSLSLEFDSAVSWTGAPGPVSHLLLLSGYADGTLLRNALSFDAFAAMRPDAPRGSIPVSWTEVFVNGEYTGVWETAPRLKDVVSGWAAPLYKVRTPEGLWTRVSAGMLDRSDDIPAGADAYAPFLELAEFVVRTTDEEFAARAGEVFDLDNLADMYLLLNFSGNMDGRVTNQYIARRRSDGRWLVLPWDYDKTFRLSEKNRPFLLSNALYKRCRSLVPGFQEKIASRWAALRAGPLSDEALERWIGERAAVLAPFVDAPPPDLGSPRIDPYAKDVGILRDQVLFRARELDAHLSAAP